MSLGSELLATTIALLAEFTATPRVVSFRLQDRTGGNARLGIGGTVTTTDVIADPQPTAQLLRTEEIAGSGGFLQPGDWEFLFPGTVEEETLQTNYLLFGDTEVLAIVRYEPFPVNGIVVAWRVIGRTIQTR